MAQSIARVFPSRTSATPVDDMAFVGDPPFPTMQPEADAVHVSCTFTWDKPEAERLVVAWGKYYQTVRVGGPAYDDPGGEFVPGRYLAPGYIITSRGCPNHCDFCLVPTREGKLRTVEIRDGNNVLDNNLLACPRPHIDAVLSMLARQKKRAVFTGGLEAARLERWFVRACVEMNAERLFLAYDRPAEQQPVADAIRLIREEWPGVSLRHRVTCYVLVGRQGDSMKAAEARLQWVLDAGATPFAMYFRPEDVARRQAPPEWARFVKRWIRPAAMFPTKAGTREEENRWPRASHSA